MPIGFVGVHAVVFMAACNHFATIENQLAEGAVESAGLVERDHRTGGGLAQGPVPLIQSEDQRFDCNRVANPAESLCRDRANRQESGLEYGLERLDGASFSDLTKRPDRFR
jgi:hypothetical protein